MIPTRNRAQKTVRAVHSVLAQTKPVNEIIVVDDGSEDGTSNLLRETFSGQVIIVRHDISVGANASRNAGAQRAASRFVAFLDSDDQFLTEKIEHQLAALRETKALFSVTGWQTDTGRTFVLKPFSQTSLLKSNILGGTSGLMVDRTLLMKVPFDPKMRAVQDWELYLRLVTHGAPAVVPAPLFTYETLAQDRLTKDSRARALGHFQLYTKHIRNNPMANKGIHRYHKMLQRTLLQDAKPGLVGSDCATPFRQPLLKLLRRF